MEWFEQEVRLLERRARGLPPSSPVAFYGSSSIRLWGSLRDDFPGVDIVNLGFGGSTLEACDHFFQRIVVPRHPRSLLIYAGDNDLGDNRSPEDVDRSLGGLLGQVDDSLGPIPLAFLSIKPSPAREYLDGSIRRANALASERIAGRPNSLFIDIYPRMLDQQGRPRWELYIEDGLHLSAAGYALWTEAVGEFSTFLFGKDS